MTKTIVPAFTLTLLIAALPAAADDVAPSIRMSAACAPVGMHGPSNAPLVLALESQSRLLYNAGERVAVSGGARQGLAVGQRFFVRRPLSDRAEPDGEHTAGWLRIVETREASATAVIESACDAVAIGDHLEPFVDPSLPHGVDRTNATGTVDFAKSATVLYGNDGRQMAGDRDFVVASSGKKHGVSVGARYAVYHREIVNRDAPVSFAEAVVVAVFDDKSLLRITETHDAVQSGDMLVQREGVVDFIDARQIVPMPPEKPGGGEGSALPSRASKEDDVAELIHRVSFEDLAFDFDKYTLKADALALLDQAVQVLEKNPTLKIRVEGYSCNIGTEKYNLALGKRRANAVRTYLVRHGVDPKRLTTVSFGESKAKYDNSHADTRRLNRRAALVVDIER
jgi:outer membrane protein OmpA-like peptidoglycan-associated protein